MNRFIDIFLGLFMVLSVSGCGKQTETAGIELLADRLEVIADGKDAVRLTVMMNDEDVTDRASFHVDGENYPSSLFSVTAPGVYEVKASVGPASSDAIQITALDPGSSGVSDFAKQVALWEFTGAWCTMCPAGYTTINFVLSSDPFLSENVHMMAFHSNGAGEDDLALSETDLIMEHLNLTEFPSFSVDMKTGGSVDAPALRKTLNEALSSPVTCGVAVSSELNGGKASVSVKLHSEVNSVWRVAVYVVEDKVKYFQKDGSMTHEQYSHRHVVRDIVSSSFHGDRIGAGVMTAGTEASLVYDVEIDPEWNLQETYVYVLALDRDGVVDNMNYCIISDGESDYIKTNLLG